MFNPTENDHPCPDGLLHRETGVVLYILQHLLHAGIGREAAVHRQADAGNEARCVIVQQKQQCARKVFFAVAKVAYGGGGKDLFGALGGGAILVEEQLCVLLAGKKARAMALTRMPTLM